MADLWQTFLDATFAIQAGIVITVLAVLWILWKIFGRGPRRKRLLARAQTLLRHGKWSQALGLLANSGVGLRRSAAWNARFKKVEAECHELALSEAIAAKEFETAIDHALAAARLGDKSESAKRGQVIEAMLAEVRRFYSSNRADDAKALHSLLTRIFQVQPSCAEASFWQGLCALREGKSDAAWKSLEAARAASQETAGNDAKSKRSVWLDPSLYLGAILLRAGKPKEALRYLTEANRVDARSPFVGCALGMGMVAAGRDASLAARALGRALGPQGFERWSKNPERAWAEGLPEGNSFVRKLAATHPFQCPLWGTDARPLRYEGFLALGQAHYRLGNFADAKATFEKLIHETAPTYAALRGLGLALARLGQHDEAFTHLKTAHDMEAEKDRLTAGYLALCGAKAKPATEDDKAQNTLWAIRLVTRFPSLGDAEWANILSAIFAEARQASVPLNQDDQIHLCDHLASVTATDFAAAAAYHHLIATCPETMKPEYAWLYSRAAQQHGHAGPCSTALFARTFQNSGPAREFFEQKGWDLEEVELAYLRQAAECEPGQFPFALGSDYAARGERLLFDRSLKQEHANDLDGSLATAHVLLKLAPQSPRAHDRVAQLWYRKGDRDRAITVLNQWHDREASNPLPLARLAVLHHERDEDHLANERIEQALKLTHGQVHADLAYLGARLALGAHESEAAPTNGHPAKRYEMALALLDRCLAAAPNHGPALSLVAGIRWVTGDKTALAAQANAVPVDDLAEPRLRYFTALANLAAGRYEMVRALCEPLTKSPDISVNGEQKQKVDEASNAAPVDLSGEASFLAGWAASLQGDLSAAVDFLARAARAGEGASVRHARALAGRLCLMEARPEEAVAWWKSLDAQTQKRWRIDEALGDTVFLSALEGLACGEYEQAAERIREAGRLGCRDRRLGALLTLSLVSAGQKLIYGS